MTISWQLGVAGTLDSERRAQKNSQRLYDGKRGDGGYRSKFNHLLLLLICHRETILMPAHPLGKYVDNVVTD